MKKMNVLEQIQGYPFRLLLKYKAKELFNRLINETKGQIPDYFFPLSSWDHWIVASNNLPPEKLFKQHLSIAYCWNTMKTEYAIDPVILKSIIDSDSPSKLPITILNTIPYWAGYINLNTAPIEVFGVEVTGIVMGWTTDDDGKPLFYFSYPSEEKDSSDIFPSIFTISTDSNLTLEEVILSEKSILKAIDKLEISKEDALKALEKDGIVDFYRKLFNLAFYVASEFMHFDTKTIRDIAKESLVKRKGKIYSISYRNAHRKLSLGKEDAALLTQDHAKYAAQLTSRRAHFRRGHFHGYWTGPRDGERKLLVKWIKPIVVSGTESKKTP